MDRLPPGRQCAESDEDVRSLAVFMKAIEQAQSMERHSVRDRAAEEFDSDRIVDAVTTTLDTPRLCEEAGRGPNGKADAKVRRKMFRLRKRIRLV